MSNKAAIITSNRWSNVLINAILTLTIGLVLILVPNTVYTTIIVIIGIIMILVGLSFMGYTHFFKGITTKSKTIFFTQSIINIIVGLFMTFQSEIVYNFIIYFIAIWLIITGATQLFSAPSQKNYIPYTNIILVNGIIALGIGVTILIWPEFPMVFIGYISVYISIILFYYSFTSFKHRNQNSKIVFENTVDIDSEEINK